DWLDFTYRAGISTRSLTQKDFQNIFTFTPYTKSQSSASTYKHSDDIGFVEDNTRNTIRLNSDFLVGFNEQINDDFRFRATAAASLRHEERSNDRGRVNGLVVPGVYNLGNSTNTPEATGAYYAARQVGVWGDIN